MGRKPINDPNLFAKRQFDKLLEKLDPEAAAERPEPEPQGKGPKAVEAGCKGGLKSGPARAKSQSAKKRKLIVKKGERARWESR